MKVKFTLALMALFCFLAVPVFAQHGSGGHGGGDSGMHSSGHDGAGHDANDDHGGHGGHDNDANEHSGKHGDHGGHGSLAKLSTNTKLAATLQALLPPGTNLQTAAQGFKNLGQFVAAVHVANTLGIPFDQLKAKITGPNAEKLGQAIHELAPTADVKAAIKQAKRQAEADLEGSEHDNDKKTASTAKHNDNDKDDDSK